MEKEVFDNIENLRRLVRVLLPSVVKKNCVESAQKLFNEYINELDNELKNIITD